MKIETDIEKLRLDPRKDITLIDAIVLLADGNPGAVIVLTQLAKVAPPALQILDALHIYGSDIYVQFKDVHKQNMNSFVADLTKQMNDGIDEIVKGMIERDDTKSN